MAIRRKQSNSTHSTTSTNNVARTYKRFLEHYRTEYSIFLTHIDGIQDQADLNKFASLMLTRFMFLYFLQHKNFLDNDPNYLSNHLKICQNCGDNTDLNFYDDFLLRILFRELNNQIHPANQVVIAGNVPYLNIDLFKESRIESDNRSIQIANEAFESIFTFFDTYYWQLDSKASLSGNMIKPDIFIYIFEKPINQKQMGPFYTQADITEYIAKNTIIPLLFKRVEII